VPMGAISFNPWALGPDPLEMPINMRAMEAVVRRTNLR
jgi:hypothetical protein